MKKHIILVIVLMIFYSIQAQNYHPLVEINKTWSTAHTYGHIYPISSDFIKFQGDTIINGFTYKQVWKCTDSSQSNWSRDGYIREINKQVFYLTWSGGAPNNLLYDFGAESGDTIYLFADPMGAYLVVDSISVFTLGNGEARRQINLSGYFGGTKFGTDTWVEGMGSLYGVLQSGSCILVGDDPQLMCFTENGTLKYFNPFFTHCYLITGLESQKPQSQTIKVFPNPAIDNVFIEVNDLASLPSIATIFDFTGRKLLEVKLTERSTKLNLTHIPESSILFCQIIGANGILTTLKVITNK